MKVQLQFKPLFYLFVYLFFLLSAEGRGKLRVKMEGEERGARVKCKVPDVEEKCEKEKVGG